MQHLAAMEIEKRMVRATVCPICHQRPRGSESLPPSVQRPCESSCPILQHIDELFEIAVSESEAQQDNYESAIVARVCNRLCKRPDAGDYCMHRLNESCPLARYMGEIIAALQALSAAHVSH